jgi:sulfate adenylyltransferase
MPSNTPPPYGGTLVDLLATPERAAQLNAELGPLPSWPLSARQLCDLEMLAGGWFSPLTGFMNQADYQAVLDRKQLANGTAWPLPICLDVDKTTAKDLSTCDRLVLRDPEGVALAVLTIEDKWTPDLSAEAKAVFGTDDANHPGVAGLLHKTQPVCLGGALECLQLPVQLDFADLRLNPKGLRAEFAKRGWEKIAVFQTRSSIHKAQQHMCSQLMEENDCALLISPKIGMPDPGENKHYALVRSYQAILDRFPGDQVMLNLLPLASRMAGPREALLHAIVQQNAGCTHFIAGPDLASPPDGTGPRPYYGPYEARDFLTNQKTDLAIQVLPVNRTVYLPGDDRFEDEKKVVPGKATWTLSGSDLSDMLQRGMDLPTWFTWPEVEHELRAIQPPRAKQGLTVFFTGLPSSGKSTVARGLRVRLLELGGRQVTLLDGDVVRSHLSKKLGFSKEDRDINIRRIGFVASEITKNGGVAICAPIAPYNAHRQDVREMVTARGGYVLIHIATPLEACEQRDRKGLYKLAREGIVKEFTGISDPYEIPEDADLALDTAEMTPEASVDAVMQVLREKGFIA